MRVIIGGPGIAESVSSAAGCAAWQTLTRGRSPLCTAIEALEPALAPPAQLGLSPRGPAEAGSASPPLVYVAAGGDEIGLWDVAAGRCRQVGGFVLRV